jgi:hypothetical protein
MKQINDENIDEIMFQLLEGEINGQEREQLLAAIEADEAYSKLWEAWQQTILAPEIEIPVMDVSKLKKKTAKIIPLHYKYAIAAMLVLGLGLAIFLINTNSKEPVITEDTRPKSHKQPSIEIPKPEIKTGYDTPKDSASIPLKEKIRTMAIEQIKVNPEIEINKPDNNDTDEKVIAKLPDAKTPTTKLADIEDDPNSHIVVTMTSESKPILAKKDFDPAETQQKKTLFSKIFGKPKFKLENDSTTRTNKRLIIENEQYKIIAGF